jgi:hypothetical protein
MHTKSGMEGACSIEAKVDSANEPFSYNKFFTTGEDKRVFAACIGRPEDKEFNDLLERVVQAIEEAEKSSTFAEKELHHRRGDFAQVATGVSYGVGRKVATNLKHKRHDKMIAELLRNDDVKRLAQFASGEVEQLSIRASH